MRKRIILFLLAVIPLLLSGWALRSTGAQAQESLRYASSAQVREALGSQGMKAFGDTTGVKVDLFVTTSKGAVERLMKGFADMASTAEPLAPGQETYGYREIPFCRSPIAVIGNARVPVSDITEEQLRGVFTKEITNWKALGGPDEEIVVVVPARETGAFANFSRLALKRMEVKPDFSAPMSTAVVKAVRSIPGSISFIGIGHVTRDSAIRLISVGGKAPSDPQYPYQQVFAFVTKGEPAGTAKKLIDFAFTDSARAIMKDNGLVPLERK